MSVMFFLLVPLLAGLAGQVAWDRLPRSSRWRQPLQWAGVIVLAVSVTSIVWSASNVWLGAMGGAVMVALGVLRLGAGCNLRR